MEVPAALALANQWRATVEITPAGIDSSAYRINPSHKSRYERYNELLTAQEFSFQSRGDICDLIVFDVSRRGQTRMGDALVLTRERKFGCITRASWVWEAVYSSEQHTAIRTDRLIDHNCAHQWVSIILCLNSSCSHTRTDIVQRLYSQILTKTMCWLKYTRSIVRTARSSESHVLLITIRTTIGLCFSSKVYDENHSPFSR